jgi:outer membrane receptor protein involved in Fe transport
MSFTGGLRCSRSAVLASALLLSTAIPALAQIETVVVTAEKRAEDVQTVPIAVTAYSSEDLKAHQVTEFKDLQFSTPNVSYTKGNFTGSNFQIRGIGITAVGYDAESGVAVHMDDVFLASPPLSEASFYDLERVEVLRGPQSTLFGRGATGGAVNIITHRPDLSELSGEAEASYGNYNASQIRGYINIPIVTDELAVRLAGDWTRHDGYVKNIFDNSDIDSQDTYSLRGSVRWQPTANTTIDLIGAYSHEADSKMRSRKQLCSSDPTGTLGCLPDSLTNGVTNLNASLATIASSRQGLAGFGGSIAQALVAAGALPNNPAVISGFVGNFANMGLFDLSQQPIPPAPANVLNPPNLRQVNSDFAPVYHARDEFVALNVKQHLADWLDATFVAGYDYHATFSQQSYNSVAGQPFNPVTLATAKATLNGLLTSFGGPAYAAHYAPYLSTPGMLPVSGIGGLGLASGNIKEFLPNVSAYDQSDDYSKQNSYELRFNSSFDGPLNFLLAGYYLKQETHGDYFVMANTFDYPFLAVGSILGALQNPTGCLPQGCINPGYYHNDGTDNRLESKAVFGEVYYDIVPDTLKLTVGARYTVDSKDQIGRIFIFPGVVPIGTPTEQAAAEYLVGAGLKDFDCSNGTQPGAGCPAATPLGPNDLYQVNSVSFKKWTGRAVLNWTPKLDFTDQTTVYASYARGYKAGGFNPGVQPGLGIPPSYQPEGIDAFEVGTKNLLLNSTLQANISAWYYNYESLQVSAIVANTSVNQNISARLWGLEGEFMYVPDDNWQFNLNIGHTNSSIGDVSLIDQRNLTNGRSDVVLIKDATLAASIGQNCVLYMTGGQTLSPADNPAFQAAAAGAGLGGLFFAPPGGSKAIAAHGVAQTNFGSCNQDLAPLLNAFGYSEVDPTNGANKSDGVHVPLKGNELQNTPPWTISIGAQYTMPLDNGYNIVPRVDFYWQADMWGSIFNTSADAIGSWEMTNAQITLNAPENKWYVAAYVKNVFDEANITGEYLTSATSGLYTNIFLTDPRTFGIRVGAHF